MYPEALRNQWKQDVAEAAAKLIMPGMVIGLGTGSTATLVVHAVAARMREGLTLVGVVPTSRATADLAGQLNIPLTTLDDHPDLDMVIDGADEIDEHLFLIKGGGGALVREKIVAAATRRFIVVADATKVVPRLGTTFALPVEVIPLATTPVRRRLEQMGLTVTLRQQDQQTFTTDNGNIILDCRFPDGIADPAVWNIQLRNIVGVVDTGLFLHMAEQAIVSGPNGLTSLRPR